MSTKHILVTGCPRSGTTFLGTVLAYAGDVGYVSEPFNTDYGLAELDRQFIYLYPSMPKEERYRRIIQSLVDSRAKFKRAPLGPDLNAKQRMGRVIFRSGTNFSYLKANYNPSNRRYLFKDPMAILASEYLHRQFDMEVVAIVRHPIPTLASMQRVGVDHSLTNLADQPQLLNRYLRPLLGSVRLEKLPVLERRALIWASLNYVLYQFARSNENFVVVLHKDISMNPKETARQLYDRLDLKYSPKVEDRVELLTSPHNPTEAAAGAMHALYRNSRALATTENSWFSAKEEKLIHSLTDDVIKLFYPTLGWPQPPEPVSLRHFQTALV